MMVMGLEIGLDRNALISTAGYPPYLCAACLTGRR